MSVPTGWNEAFYLANNPDVAAAVADGRMESGWSHYVMHGLMEGRPVDWTPESQAGDVAEGTKTRLCLDPWKYLELTPNYGLKPCCKYGSLAKWTGASGSIAELRNSPTFRQLRSELLTGKLSQVCRNCHIRPMVPAPQLKQAVDAATNGKPLEAATLTDLRIELTSDCNLRCVYCPVSNPKYVGKGMAVSGFADIVSLVEAQPRSTEILVNGHGETTFHPQWLELCSKIVALGFRPSIITNFARPLLREEAECLARFKIIQVSLDTADPVLLQKIRRKVKLSTIEANIAMVRQYSPPDFPPVQISFSCGVYDRNFAKLDEFVTFALEKQVRTVTFWQLVKYDDIPDALNVYPVPSLSTDKIAAAVASLTSAVKRLRDAGVGVMVAGEFLEEWRRLLPQPA